MKDQATATLSPNEVGTLEGASYVWFGVGQSEDLDVVMLLGGGRLTVELMDFNDSIDGETIETYEGRDAARMLRKNGVRNLLAGGELFTF